MLYPAHAAAVLAIARLHNLLTIASFALLLCSTALTELLPPMDFPRPTGPHGVGRLSVELVDRSRAGWLVGDDGPRRVPVDVYYPAQPTPRLSASARWCGWVPKAILGPLVRNFKLPPFLFNHLAATQTWAREAVPPVQPAAGGSWRLVLFSHSLTGVRFQNSALCAELASHGCVVAAVEHPYEAMLSLFADGTVAPYRFVSHLPPGLTPAGLLAFREQCVAYRADDLALVHAALLRASTKGDQHGSGDGAWPGVPQAEGGEALVLLEGLLAPRSRAAVIGHSCGGGGAALYAQRAGPERVRSALLLDGFVWWLGRARVAAGLRVPLLSLRTPKFLNDNDEFCVCNDELLDKLCAATPTSLTAVLPASHFDFTDMSPRRLNHVLHSDHVPVTGLIARAAGASAWRRTCCAGLEFNGSGGPFTFGCCISREATCSRTASPVLTPFAWWPERHPSRLCGTPNLSSRPRRRRRASLGGVQRSYSSSNGWWSWRDAASPSRSSTRCHVRCHSRLKSWHASWHASSARRRRARCSSRSMLY